MVSAPVSVVGLLVVVVTAPVSFPLCFLGWSMHYLLHCPCQVIGVPYLPIVLIVALTGIAMFSVMSFEMIHK